jgi:hypothetical protein
LALDPGSDQADQPAGSYTQDQDHLESAGTAAYARSASAEDQQAEHDQGDQDLDMSFFDLCG